MRTLCLLLILTNALFFIWAELIDVQANSLDRPAPRRASATSRIVLAQEAESAPAMVRPQPEGIEPPAPSEGVGPQVATAGAPECTTVGPFADLANASQAQASLRAAGFEPRQRLEQGELWVGYWVSVQNLPSREAAEESVRTLAERGITDVYIMPGSDPANVLSLGVFSDYQRAQRRANEIRALGLEPQIDDRKRAGSAYWIDVDLSAPDQKIDMTLFQTSPGKIMRLELRGCPREAAG